MNRKLTKLAALAVALAFVVTLFAACGTSDTTHESDGHEEMTTVAPITASPVVITYNGEWPTCLPPAPFAGKATENTEKIFSWESNKASRIRDFAEQCRELGFVNANDDPIFNRYKDSINKGEYLEVYFMKNASGLVLAMGCSVAVSGYDHSYVGKCEIHLLSSV